MGNGRDQYCSPNNFFFFFFFNKGSITFDKLLSISRVLSVLLLSYTVPLDWTDLILNKFALVFMSGFPSALRVMSGVFCE